MYSILAAAVAAARSLAPSSITTEIQTWTVIYLTEKPNLPINYLTNRFQSQQMSLATFLESPEMYVHFMHFNHFVKGISYVMIQSCTVASVCLPGQLHSSGSVIIIRQFPSIKERLRNQKPLFVDRTKHLYMCTSLLLVYFIIKHYWEIIFYRVTHSITGLNFRDIHLTILNVKVRNDIGRLII